MQLYHGSNISVKQPQIIQPDRRLDFGAGFYLTSNSEQAEKWAQITTKRRGKGCPVVTIYEFDETKIKKLNVLKFDNPSEEWLEFVSKNRNVADYRDDYDIVIGPVANDKTMPVLKLYFSGIYDEKETIKRLVPQKLYDQYTFKSNNALQLLSVKEVREL